MNNEDIKKMYKAAVADVAEMIDGASNFRLEEYSYTDQQITISFLLPGVFMPGRYYRVVCFEDGEISSVQLLES